MRWQRMSTRGRAWPILFVVLATALGLLAVIGTPLLRGTDEPAHLRRVALIDRGFVTPSTASRTPTNYRVDDCFTATFERSRMIAYLEVRPTWADQFRNAPCLPRPGSIADGSRTADVYSPVPYVPALVGFRVGRAIGGATGSILGARLVQLAAFVALMGYAIARSPWGKPLFFVIGMLPVSLQGAANVSADPMTLALACTAVALTLSCIDTGRHGVVTRTRLIALAGTIAALMLCKSAYVPFVLLIAAIPTAAFGSLRRRITSTATTVSLAAILAGAWNLGVVADIRILGVNHSDSVVAARWIRHNPRGFLKAVAAGWSSDKEVRMVLEGLFFPARRFASNFPLPIWLGLSSLLIARLVDPLPRLIRRVALALRCTNSGDSTGRRPPATGEPAFDSATRLQGLAVAVTIGATTFLLVEYGLAIAANPPAPSIVRWVQGRYFLPLLPLTLLGVTGSTPVIRSRLLWLFPAASTGVFVWWLWWVSHNLWFWF